MQAISAPAVPQTGVRRAASLRVRKWRAGTRTRVTSRPWEANQITQNSIQQATELGYTRSHVHCTYKLCRALLRHRAYKSATQNQCNRNPGAQKKCAAPSQGLRDQWLTTKNSSFVSLPRFILGMRSFKMGTMGCILCIQSYYTKTMGLVVCLRLKRGRSQTTLSGLPCPQKKNKTRTH